MAEFKLHEKCKECEHKDNCDNKRMVVCGYLSPDMQVNINVNIQSNASLEEDINRYLEKQVNKQINCSFMFDELRRLK